MLNQPKYKLVAFSGKERSGSKQTSVYNKVYSYWKDVWKFEFGLVGSPHAWSADHFLRQDLIFVLLHDEEVVAFSMHTFYDLHLLSVRDCNYLSIFPLEVIRLLDTNLVESLMTIEFLTVMPKWRKKRIVGHSAAGLMSAVALKYFQKSGADAAVGVTRKDYGVHALARSFGSHSIEQEIKRGNLVCEINLFYPHQIKNLESVEADILAESLVNNYLGIHKQEHTTNLVA